jgi:hypothetical protein
MTVKLLHNNSLLQCITMNSKPQMSILWAIKHYEWTSYKSFVSNFIYSTDKNNTCA